MATLTTSFPTLSADVVSLYFANDVLLDNLPLLVFYGPSTTANATQSNSRIQAHIYSLAGLQSFPRLTTAPTSPLYAAVKHLPADLQGDEVFRGLAISILSYFAGASKATKDFLKELAARRRPNRLAPAMFDEMHAGDLASRMKRADETEQVLEYLHSAIAAQSISWVDIDLVLPPNTIERVMTTKGTEKSPVVGDDGFPLYRYGPYSSLLSNFGSPGFLPTSKLRRAPSMPTAHSRARILLKEQKIALRREMCELLDTERRYIEKIDDLVNIVTTEFRQCEDTGFEGDVRLRESPDLVNRLFPESLPNILNANKQFYFEIESILAETEDMAIRDIEGNCRADTESTNVASKRRDPTGTLVFAKTLLRWFPRFLAPYQDYLRASANFSHYFSKLVLDNASNLSMKMQEFGEQRLRSMLIEPVQRLPRYSLFIDNMINQIPASHPAMASLLKAKDSVTDICALDSGSAMDTTKTSSSLRKMIRDWPSWLSPRGRLITALDVLELDPPYDTNSNRRDCILLLFPDSLIVVQKTDANSLSARGILAEMDRPAVSIQMAAAADLAHDRGLVFSTAFGLSKLQIVESKAGQHVRLVHTIGSTTQSHVSHGGASFFECQVKVFSLLGPYENKGARLSEEIAKAKIEGRFPEAARESDRWVLRIVDPDSSGLGIIAAVYENGINGDGLLASTSRLQVTAGGEPGFNSLPKENGTIDIEAQIIPIDSDRFCLNLQGADGSRCTESALNERIGPVLAKNCKLAFVKFTSVGAVLNGPPVAQLLQVQNLSRTRLSAVSQMSFDRNVLQSLPFRKKDEGSHLRAFRPLSPIKLVSNLFGNSPGQPSTPSKKQSDTLKLNEAPIMLPPHSKNNEPLILSESKVKLLGATIEGPADTLAALEATFTAYILALHSRSGNVVGKVLRGRAGADELLVNELYNILIEDPSNLQAAAEVPIDILFCSFEKFIKRAWYDRMGPLMTKNILESLQASFDSGKPGDFVYTFKRLSDEMTPQNRRALGAAIKLLSDLLEASGNDGDRGALVASFAEALVPDSNSHCYIYLFDRLVDDHDILFGPIDDLAGDGNNISSASDSLGRTRTPHKGSTSSNTSSLRRKFGLGGLSRENSKAEPESKIASVWRTLSKSAKLPEGQQFGSLSKGSLSRSRSTDMDARMLSPVRPVSRDRPTPNQSPRSESQSRPTSSHLNFPVLETIGEVTPNNSSMIPKKKRRSSLSDLKPVQDAAGLSPWPPLKPHKPASQTHTPNLFKSPPRTPTTSKPTITQPADGGYAQRFGSPDRFGSTRKGSPQRFRSPNQKENSPPQHRSPKKREYAPSTTKQDFGRQTTAKIANEIVITSLNLGKGATSHSGIPAPKGGLRERTWPPNGTTAPPKSATPGPKLRIQSPQKLRERLSNEQKALSVADSGLQSEMAKIGEELAAFKVSVPNARATGSTPKSPDVEALASSVAQLQTRLSTFVKDFTAANELIKKDVEFSLTVSEKKARKLDELYREANAENEALYERFNDELGKMLKGVKSGGGYEEMRLKMEEAQEDAVKLKKENQRLKREVIGLRSQLPGG
ncbi:MAG: hypothetical protein LQ351_002560 [Letrouitia transgressa]|nr:MAG: hypothetical protein LQ351_002560 [Letrouitia transgressa]